ncbi:L-type lectin-domain containing receptor kinase IX.1-like [Typha latifolia]|uniref:L-type lectin-domain containing receptor kinase IX.1-like n=1 Tax=Typha latifolia TaxID=4733 RepID=UPI003C2FDBA8
MAVARAELAAFRSKMYVLFFFCSIIIPYANSQQFNYDFASLGSENTTNVIDLRGDASFDREFISLTKDTLGGSINNSAGQAVYKEPVPLWDNTTGEEANFLTSFSFIIKATQTSSHADGLAFFLSSYPLNRPELALGGNLGLFNDSSKLDPSANHLVAVEFDTFWNEWDHSESHIGIDINSINSTVYEEMDYSLIDGRRATAWIGYNASTKVLGVFLSYENSLTFNGSFGLSCNVDLKKLLPNKVAIGFSAATGSVIELHQILSWNFNSTLVLKKNMIPPSPSPSPAIEAGPSISLSPENVTKNESKIGVVAGSIASALVLLCLIGLVAFLLRHNNNKKKNKVDREEEYLDYDEYFDDEFEKGRGPKRYCYEDLSVVTKNFAEEGKLGEGGFGSVYRGFMKDLDLHVAIKRVSKGSKQGRKEYASEVKIISRLRHRNLVQLVGWCHDRGNLLLVYELMPNGSLDSHLHNGERLLTWPTRYNVAIGVASAILYLHRDWEQCVLHRDIKPSNVMLDSSFNAKLGDFGLARLVDHGNGSQTTVLAGTMGYMAPECFTTGKASTESDVYSFGVVLLEIACGRRPIEPFEEAKKVRLVDWVWDLYGRRAHLEAADERLNGEFEEQEMERLMVVGLWCAHPDCIMRPSIKKAIAALQFESPLPTLPPKMPVPMFALSMDSYNFNTSSVVNSTASGGFGTTHSSYATTASGSSSPVWLLKQHSNKF